MSVSWCRLPNVFTVIAGSAHQTLKHFVPVTVDTQGLSVTLVSHICTTRRHWKPRRASDEKRGLSSFNGLLTPKRVDIDRRIWQQKKLILEQPDLFLNSRIPLGSTM